MADGASKGVKIGIVIFLAVAGFFGYQFVRWQVIYEMRVGEVMTAFPRYPNAQDITGLKQKVIDAAAPAHLPTEGLEVTVYLQQKEIGGASLHQENADRWWFVCVDAKQGRFGPSHWEKRIENTIADTNKEEIQKGGVAYRAPAVKK